MTVKRHGVVDVDGNWHGNVTIVTDRSGQIEQHNGYYPYGEMWREPRGPHQTLFAAKERQTGTAAGSTDFGPLITIDILLIVTLAGVFYGNLVANHNYFMRLHH